MVPVWFFVFLFLLIGYLLYVTRPTEDTLLDMGRNQVRKIQYWLKGAKD